MPATGPPQRVEDAAPTLQHFPNLLHTHHTQTILTLPPDNLNLLPGFTRPHITLGPGSAAPKLHPSLLSPPHLLPHLQRPLPATHHQPSPHPRRPPSLGPADSLSGIPSLPLPSDTSNPAPLDLAPPLHHRAPPLALEALLRAGPSPPLSPAPYRHAQGQPDPARPHGDPRAEACGRGVASPRPPPQIPLPPSLLPLGTRGVGDRPGCAPLPPRLPGALPLPEKEAAAAAWRCRRLRHRCRRHQG